MGTAILGLSAFYHDSAAALVVDGRIVAAAQEERFSRKKHDHEFPTHAVEFCLRQGGLEPEQLDYVGFYDKPLLKFGRLIETYLTYAPRGFASFLQAMPLWLRQKLHLPREMSEALSGAYTKRYVFTEHHESHAASAFFPSPYDEAAILTMDGVGEWATMSYGVGKGNRISLAGQMDFPHSLGLLYSAFTYYCGFEVNSGEYKLMGLAPYGEPRYVNLILDKLLDLKADGSFRMDMSYFNYCEGLTMTSQKFHELFGGPPRKSGAPLTERDMDIAASVQRVTEEIVLRIARHVHAETGMSKLCLAGGVALNCVANGRVLREGPFDDIWIQPAAGDAGGALGTALFIWYQLLGNARQAAPSDAQHGSLLGPTFGDEDIRSYLDSVGSVYHHIADDGALCEDIARRIADGKVIGWFQAAMEFGPRALGARSILGDARSPAMQAIMNLKVKFRESFRPFAPAVLREHVSEYFGTREGLDSPYMLLVAPVLESRCRHVGEDEAYRTGLDKLSVHRSEIPAATHVDYSARIQTVDRERHGLYHGVIDAFYRQTGCPVVVNTSFNLGWDPIVCTPKEAYHTFMSSDIDVLCMGHYVLAKAEQPAERHALALPGVRAYTSEPWSCPCGHGAALVAHEGGLRCSACGHKFIITDGIPQLFWPHEKFGANTDVTEAVKAFYEETPFPNYDEHDSVRSLIDKSRRGIYAHMLNEGLPFNGRILEVGCGTGQLTNFLGISCREVIGVDLCLNSLRLAEQFRSEHGLERVRFAQMNLFRPTFTAEQFDVILCNGVLHHTADPYGGFKGLVPLLKPGGYIIIGLYNKYGRLMTDLRRAIFRMTGGRATWLDPYLRSTKMSREKRRAWFADQYQHPHESKHTIGEVLDWFDETGLNFVRGIPSTTGSPAGDDLFAPEPPGSALNHATVQAKQIITGSREGGFFLMIGRKPEQADAAIRRPDGEDDAMRRPDGQNDANRRPDGRHSDTVRRAS